MFMKCELGHYREDWNELSWSVDRIIVKYKLDIHEVWPWSLSWSVDRIIVK